ncbi:uncharacterized protein TNCV_1943621 [Trichonephila clavipes]|nr:uncharacterized protein TNCV_1943621 [Trichonephila clavipes]
MTLAKITGYLLLGPNGFEKCGVHSVETINRHRKSGPIMSKRCGECEQTKFALEEDSSKFRTWYEEHEDVCRATHVGTSGASEVNAAVKLWERSENIGFRYTTMLSDGDSKSFLELKEMNVYGSETQIKKKNVSSHVSKRLETALRQTVKD